MVWQGGLVMGEEHYAEGLWGGEGGGREGEEAYGEGPQQNMGDEGTGG